MFKEDIVMLSTLEKQCLHTGGRMFAKLVAHTLQADRHVVITGVEQATM